MSQKARKYSKMDGDLSKRYRSQLKEFPLPNLGQVEQQKIMDQSSKNPELHSNTQNKEKNKNLWVLGGGEGKDFLHQRMPTNECRRSDRDGIYSLHDFNLISPNHQSNYIFLETKYKSICISTHLAMCIYLDFIFRFPANIGLKNYHYKLIFI